MIDPAEQDDVNEETLDDTGADTDKNVVGVTILLMVKYSTAHFSFSLILRHP